MIGSSGCLELGQQIVGVGIGGRQGGAGIRGSRGGGQTVHAVVGVVGTSGIGIIGVFYPLQHIGIGVVAVGGDVARCVLGGGQAVAIGSIGGRGGNAAADGDGEVIAPGIIGEGVHHALGGGGLGHIVLAVVFIGQHRAAGEGLLGQVSGGVVGISGGAALDILDRRHIALGIVGIAAAEGLLEQLDAVKVGGVDIVAVVKGDGDGTVGLFRDDGQRGVLPVDAAVRVRVEGDGEVLLGAVGVVDGGF